MQRSLTTLIFGLAITHAAFSQQITDAPKIESVSGCAAVVETTAICSTCLTAACVVPVTITAGCGTCPVNPATIYRSHDCSQGCDGLGCRTVYTVVTSQGKECPTPTATPDGGSQQGTALSSVSTGAAARIAPLRLW